MGGSPSRMAQGLGGGRGEGAMKQATLVGWWERVKLTM